MTDRDPKPALRRADAYGVGVTRGRLAGPGWVMPLRGVVRPAGGPAPTPLQRIWDVAELLPSGAALGGWSAAYLLGATDLDGRGPSGTESRPVPVVLPPPLLIRARPELVRWRSDLEEGDVIEIDGVPCTTGSRTGFDLARLGTLRAGVIALDVLGRQAVVRPSAVLAYARRHPRWRGKPQSYEAVRLADPRARSSGETRLRLTWVLDAGLPVPEANATIRGPDGILLGIGDLLDPEAGLLGEYDGAGHRDERQHALDNAREEWFEDNGLVVVRASAPDLWPANRRRTVLRLQTGHRRASARDRNADTWTWTPAPRLD
ncbi:MAG TPA: hypothetical protein VH857_11510 [Actinomycetes bacterium]|nr:hypothetical protein [Actinomycetes bacterium]